jgi:hypothetical protein
MDQKVQQSYAGLPGGTTMSEIEQLLEFTKLQAEKIKHLEEMLRGYKELVDEYSKRYKETLDWLAKKAG